jgi:hypothetical protein
MPDISHVATSPWGRSTITSGLSALLIFIVLWFDPRIGYMQRDISDVRTYVATVDINGTRKSQQEVASILPRIEEDERRIAALEEQGKHIDQTLTAILEKLSVRNVK